MKGESVFYCEKTLRSFFTFQRGGILTLLINGVHLVKYKIFYGGYQYVFTLSSDTR